MLPVEFFRTLLFDAQKPNTKCLLPASVYKIIRFFLSFSPFLSGHSPVAIIFIFYLSQFMEKMISLWKHFWWINTEKSEPRQKKNTGIWGVSHPWRTGIHQASYKNMRTISKPFPHWMFSRCCFQVAPNLKAVWGLALPPGNHGAKRRSQIASKWRQGNWQSKNQVPPNWSEWKWRYTFRIRSQAEQSANELSLRCWLDVI